MPHDLPWFVTALVVVYLLPGADMILLLALTWQRGRRAGMEVALGLALARSVHVTLASLGLAGLLAARPELLGALQLLGAGYLGWLAWQIFRAPLAGPASPIATNTAAPWRQGLLTNLLNPKALMFCSLLLPQFIQPQAPLGVQYLLLGSILVGLGLAFDLLYALGAARLPAGWRQHPGFVAVQRYVFPGLLALAALRLGGGLG